MEKIIHFLTQLGYNKKEATIYTTLYTMGASPASSVARKAWYERVYTYKALQKMINDGIVAQTKKSWTTHFWIPDSTLLLAYIQKQEQTRKNREAQFQHIQQELASLQENTVSYAPKIQFFEGEQQIKNLFALIPELIEQQNLLVLSIFWTHTFQEQIIANKTVSLYTQPLSQYLNDKNISITSYIAEGGLIMEQLKSYSHIEKISELPAGDNAINMFIIGQIVVIVIYKWQPVGLKIESPEFARALNFVLKQTGKW